MYQRHTLSVAFGGNYASPVGSNLRPLMTGSRSTFWHKYQRQRMTSPATFITNTLLGLQRGTLMSRYTHLFFVFWISGLMHALSDIAQGMPWQESTSIRFFCIQALGIIAEDTLLALRPRRSVRTIDSSGTWLFKILGYLWVMVFMVWSTPIWIYPSLSRNKAEDKYQVVPFSVVKWIGKNSKMYLPS